MTQTNFTVSVYMIITREHSLRDYPLKILFFIMQYLILFPYLIFREST